MSTTHVVVEVLDARIPYSSRNPLLAGIVSRKPVIRVLNKYDLADEDRTALWFESLENDAAAVIPASIHDPASIRAILRACQELAPDLAEYRMAEVMVIGIPNVGKSSIINALAARTVAKTGNEPAVTRQQQRIRLDEQLVLSDSPGVMLPNVENPASSFRLALTGAIRNTAYDSADLGWYAVESLMQSYPQRLMERYELDELASGTEQVLEQIAARRGALGGGGSVNYQKLGELLITDIRSGKLGRLTLETPTDIERELAQTSE